MAKDLFGCIIKTPEGTFKQKKTNPSELTDAEKRIDHYINKANIARSIPDTNPYKLSELAKMDAMRHKMEVIGNTLEIGKYDTNFRKAIEVRTTTKLGQLVKKIQGTNIKDMTRMELVRFRRNISGVVKDAFAQVEVAKLVDNLQKNYKNIYTKLDIPKQQAQEMLQDLMLVQHNPALIEAKLGANEPLLRTLNSAQDDILDRLLGAGIKGDDLEYLVSETRRITTAYDEVLGILDRAGLDIGFMKDLGYFQHIFTREADQMLDIIKKGGDLQTLIDDAGKADIMSHLKDLGKARSYTVDRTLRASAVVDDLFQRGGIYNRLNERIASNPYLQKVLGGKDKVYNLTDILKHEKGDDVLLDVVVNVLKDEELSFLVDNGLLHELPWTTGKIFDFLRENYKFPFDGLDDVFMLDPRKANRLYMEQLESLALEQGQLQGIIKGATDGGWGIHRAEVKAQGLKEFVPLKKAFPDKQLPKVRGILGDAGDSVLDDIFVHKDVAAMIKADYTLASDPIFVGSVSQLLRTVRTISNTYLLATPSWMMKQIVQWTGTVASVGASPLRYIQNYTLHAVGAANAARKGNSFDFASMLGKKKVYGGGKYSAQDLWRMAVKKQLINDFSIVGQGGRQLNPRSLKRTANEISWLRQYFPDHFKRTDGGIEVVLDLTKSMHENFIASKLVGWGNESTDNIGRFTILQDILADNRLPSVLTGLPKMDDVDDAIQYVFKNTWSFDEIDQKAWHQNSVVNFVVPFLNFRMKNMQHAWTQAINHPNRTAAYIQLNQRPMEEHRRKYPTEHELMLNDWIDPSDFPIPWVIPADVSATGRDEHVMFGLATLIPSLSAVGDFKEILDIFGVFNNEGAIADHPKNPFNKDLKDNSIVQYIRENGSAISKTLTNLVLGEDNYGRSLKEIDKFGSEQTLLGVPVPSAVKMGIENTVPMIKLTEKLLSLAGFMGTSEEFDPISQEYTSFGTPNVFTGKVPEKATYQQKMAYQGSVAWVTTILGMTVYNKDLAERLYYTEKDIDKNLKVAEKLLKDKADTIAKNPNDSKVVDEYNNLRNWYAMQLLERDFYENYRNKTGLPAPKLRDKLKGQARNRREELEIHNLFTPEERDEIVRRRTQLLIKDGLIEP